MSSQMWRYVEERTDVSPIRSSWSPGLRLPAASWWRESAVR